METEHFFICPYCWQEISMVLDLSAGTQDYIEDCEVCCRPIRITFECGSDGPEGFEAASIEQ